MAKLSPIGNNAQFINGVPANGAKLFFYAAGSSTKQTTYTDEAGLVPQTNPIILDSRGEPSQPIWLTEGLSYKVVFTSSTDTDPPVSPIWDIDNVTGINDASLTIDQWINSGVTPVYVSATQFTVSGDQTSMFQVNRRVKLLVTSGTVYGYISASAYAALTTVTVVLDSGVLDSGLSSVQLGLITPNNTSLFLIQNPNISNSYINDLATVPFDYSSDKVAIADASDGGNKKNSLLSSNKLQPITATVGSNALTLTLNPTSIDFRSSTLGNGTVNTRQVAAAITLVVSSGSTLGTTSAIQSRLAVLAIDNAGTVELAVVNVAGGTQLDETNLITTIAEGGAGAADSVNVIYSTTARASVPYRVVGFIESTQVTAGTWVTSPSLIQGAGGQALQHVGSILSGAPIATTSGTSVDVTGLPSWVKRITITFNGVSTNGTSRLQLQIGDSGGIETTGYLSVASGIGVAANSTGTSGVVTTGYVLDGFVNGSGQVKQGSIVISMIDSLTWSIFGVLSDSGAVVSSTMIGGTKALSGILDRFRLTTVNGTDAFDLGSISYLYE